MVSVVPTWIRAGGHGALLFLILTLAGCRVLGNDVVKVTVIFAAPGGDRQVTDLSAIVGSDKSSWPSLNGGAQKSVNLLPGPEDDRQLTLLYTFDGDKRSWEGPKIAAGAGYRIEITIDASGHVSSRHCILPCSLS